MVKSKNGSKKILLPIKTYSLLTTPNDAVEGYQERIETGIEWTLVEEAVRDHKKDCSRENIPSRTFSEALEIKLKRSILGGLLDEKSKLSLKDYLDSALATIWDSNKFGSDEKKLIFLANNTFIDNIEAMLRKIVKLGNRKYLSEELHKVSCLRIINANLTDLDKGLLNFKYLEHLTLCGNFIKSLDEECLPQSLRILELQANAIKNVRDITKNLPSRLYYLGLARNLLCDDLISGLSYLPQYLVVLDLADNDIYYLTPVLNALVGLDTLSSLTLAGNPCSVSAGYAVATIKTLPKLKWLDDRQILAKDRLEEKPKKDLHHSYSTDETKIDDLHSAFFIFKTIRILSIPPPPKVEKGYIGTYHVELEIPLLDSKRRNFLMFRDNASLIEYPPEGEDDSTDSEPMTLLIDTSIKDRRMTSIRYLAPPLEAHPSLIYHCMERKPYKEIHNYQVYESNRLPWSYNMCFQEPTVKIFCPDLRALRNTFCSTLTVRLVYTLTQTSKTSKDRGHGIRPPVEYIVVLANVRCTLKRPDWSQKSQHFHWDKSMDTNDAIHWEDGDLEALQYIFPQSRVAKRDKKELEADSVVKQAMPRNLTCHYSFGIETLFHHSPVNVTKK